MNIKTEDLLAIVAVIVVIYLGIMIGFTSTNYYYSHNEKSHLEELKLESTLKKLKEARSELTDIQKEAIKRGYATIDHETKEFKWKRWCED